MCFVRRLDPSIRGQPSQGGGGQHATRLARRRADRTARQSAAHEIPGTVGPARQSAAHEIPGTARLHVHVHVHVKQL